MNVQTLRVDLCFPGARAIDFSVTPVDENLYRMESSCCWCDEMEIMYHDIIEAKIQGDGSLRVMRVAERSKLHTLIFAVPKPMLDSDEFWNFRDKVVAAGGYTEVEMGSLLLLHLPATEKDRFLDEYSRLYDQLRERDKRRPNDL